MLTGEAASDLSTAEVELQQVGHLILHGRLQEAETALQRIISQRPDDPDPHYSLGVIYLNTQRLEQAAAALQRAIEADPEFAEAHCNLGTVWTIQGRPDDALASYERAIAIDPELADAHSRRGEMLLSLGRSTEAVASFRRAAEAEPDSPIGQLAEAQALSTEGRLAEAEALLRGVIATAPRPAAMRAHCLLGTVLGQLGRFDEAIASFDEAIRIAPKDPNPYAGRVSVAKLSEADRPMVHAMVALLDGPVPDGLRMSLHFGLGKAFDDLGDYAAAIRQFEAANELRQRRGRLNCGGLASWVDRLTARCTPAFFARPAPSRRERPAPIFILGMPRSGTTLLEQILSSHPAVAAGGELTFWARHGRAWDHAGSNGFGIDHSASLAEEYRQVLTGISADAARVIDKNPWNFQWVGMIRQAMPDARFIHSRRHPIDTCLSIYFTQFQSTQDFMSHRGDLAFYYRQYIRLMEHWQRVLPADCYTEVDYAALIDDREAEARRLIAFCGLEWDDACLRHETNQRSVRTASVWQARQPIYRGSLARWRHYEPWLGELRGLLTASEAMT